MYFKIAFTCNRNKIFLIRNKHSIKIKKQVVAFIFIQIISVLSIK